MTNHLALYRKYRPDSFSDVVGQANAVELLTKAIESKKISHAYLFCGGRGTGKTTAARIFAKEIGCNPEDIIEIDAASNRGIDEIRELRDAVRTSPFSSPYKIYIVDEAHMLTKEAANALLKTLEEPPSHVVFILATTDPEKLPATTVSRCQKVVFVSPDIETLQKRLLYVAAKEGKKLEEKTALLIAKHGKGSYRDALGVLEQVLTTQDAVVDHKKVIDFLGLMDKEMLVMLLEALCKKDVQKLEEHISQLETKGINPLKAYDGMLDVLREGLLSRASESSSSDPEVKRLAKEFPYMVSSKTVLTLLSSRHLLEVAPSHALTALTAVYFSLIEA